MCGRIAPSTTAATDSTPSSVERYRQVGYGPADDLGSAAAASRRVGPRVVFRIFLGRYFGSAPRQAWPDRCRKEGLTRRPLGVST